MMYGFVGINREIRGVKKVCGLDTETVTGNPVTRGATGVTVTVRFATEGIVACAAAAIV